MTTSYQEGELWNLSNCSISELVSLYSQSIKELKNEGSSPYEKVLSENWENILFLNSTTEIQNFRILVLYQWEQKNINAVSQEGERYSIKSTTSNITGAIYGLEPPNSTVIDKPLFEYMVICKLDSDCSLEGIYQLSWDSFLKHKKWHSRINAWNVTVTSAMKNDSVIIYERTDATVSNDDSEKLSYSVTSDDEADVEPTEAVTWNKNEKVNHVVVREAVADRLKKTLKCNFVKTSQSRYVSSDNESALFVLSASYSQKNGEYWYSINDENIPWMELYPTCHVAFALGSAEQVLVFDFFSFSKMLEGCLRTSEDPDKKKKAHYHFSFAVEGSKVYFKKKLPEREFIEVTDCLK